MGGATKLKLLLDTHIWFWAAAEPEKLKRSVAALIDSNVHELWISSASVWELAILAEKNRLAMKLTPRQWVTQCIDVMGLAEAPIDREVALLSREIDVPQADPIDRFLAATAMIHGHSLVTSDKRLLRFDRVATISNR